jgi:hypothetical protein
MLSVCGAVGPVALVFSHWLFILLLFVFAQGLFFWPMTHLAGGRETGEREGECLGQIEQHNGPGGVLQFAAGLAEILVAVRELLLSQEATQGVVNGFRVL